MLDVKKLDSKTKMEMILIWLEYIAKKNSLSYRDEEVISNIVEYLLEEVSK